MSLWVDLASGEQERETSRRSVFDARLCISNFPVSKPGFRKYRHAARSNGD